MKYRVKEKTNRSSGQATVEYVLVMIIVIVIILGLVLQFNDAFRNYARNYFGAYLQCLLDNGELPNLGAQVAGSTCDEEFQPFDITTGRVPTFAGAGARPGQGGGRNGSSNADDSDKESVAKEPGDASGGSEKSASGRPSRFSSSSGRIGGANLRPSSFADGANGGEVGGSGSEGGSSRGRTRRVMRRNSDGTPIINERTFSDSGRQAYFQASKVDEEILKEESGSTQERFEQRGQSKKKAFEQEMQVRKIQSEEEKEELTFSNFMRYLLIAAVVIAVILFLAGQFLSISKSMEK